MKPVWPFLLLVLALSIPFWVVGAVASKELLPNLPISALMVVCPAAAAAILVCRESGKTGVAALLARAFDYRRIRSAIWYVPILLLTPGVAALSFVLMKLAGSALPDPRFPIAAAPAIFLALLVAGMLEEIGWSGYAIERMQERRSALLSAIAVGLVWAAWHLVPLAQAHRPAGWISWWSLGTVASRVLMVWIFSGTGRSVFGVALYHAMSNMSWQMFPNWGSHFDPRSNALLLLAAAAVVVAACGPRTLKPADRRS